jgi:3-(3-hydroxy-phenyl)propionate hydroxylase
MAIAKRALPQHSASAFNNPYVGGETSMRPAGRGPLDSLYFNYPYFEPPQRSDLGARAPVVIAGAGPIGMTAALTLASYGQRCVLLDRKETFNDGSRATCIARSSMRTFERIGAVDPFVEKALGWRFGRSYYRGEQIFRLEMPHPDSEKYLPMYNLQQQYTEAFLYQAIAREPLIDMRWQSEVTEVQQDGAGVRLKVQTAEQSYTLPCDYLLAADGARSPIRSMLGLRLKGENHEGRYVIADVQMAHDFPTERRALFAPRSNPGGTILVHRQPDNLWRIDFQLKDGEDEDEVLREETLRARIGPMIEEIGHHGPWELEWWSVYSANTLLLDDYRQGRVFFVGDSAHIVPIFGVRGLNNGITDAHNIGWKLAYVLQGRADEKLLDSYTPERRGATLDVFANAVKSTRFMTPPSRGWQLMRDAALSLGLRNAFTRGLANPRQMQPYTYRDSPITRFSAHDREFGAVAPASGAAAPDARLSGGYLLDLTGPDFTLLVFGDAVPSPVIDRLTARTDGLLKVLHIKDASAKQGLIDTHGDAFAVYAAKPGTVYLLRPDTHIAGRWLTFNEAEIAKALATCLGKA